MKASFAGIILILLINGCDLFKTRDPESPTEGTSTFKPPVTPEIVLENFKSAIQEHNVDNYMKCFVDTSVSSKTFLFTPSANIQSLIPSWTLEDERRYFQNLGQPISSAPFLSLSNLKTENRTPTSIEYTMNYLLFYPHRLTSVSKQVNGYMHLFLEIDKQQRWSIFRWDDTRTTTDSTWSYLKYHLY